MEEKITLKCSPGVGDVAEGEAIVSNEGFSARYDYDRYRGVISRETHELFGQSIVGKVAVFRTAKGGVATSWMMLDMVERGTCPAGFIFSRTNPVMVQGAALAQVALMHELSPDPLEAIRSGDYVRMDPQAGIVEVTRRD
jgi:predicted aconitase with swiveling domain